MSVAGAPGLGAWEHLPAAGAAVSGAASGRGHLQPPAAPARTDCGHGHRGEPRLAGNGPILCLLQPHNASGCVKRGLWLMLLCDWNSSCLDFGSVPCKTCGPVSRPDTTLVKNCRAHLSLLNYSWRALMHRGMPQIALGLLLLIGIIRLIPHCTPETAPTF